MSTGLRKVLRRSAIALVALAALCGLLLGAFRLAIDYVPGYRVQLQSWLNERTGLVIEFSAISARLRFYGPELVFDDAVLLTPDRTRTLASAKRGSVGFDLWSSLSSGRLRAGRFLLDSPQLGLIRTREGQIQLVGQSELPEHEIKPFAIEQLPLGQFRVRQAVVSFRDEITGRGPWSLSGVTFELQRRPDSLQLRGAASLPKMLGAALRFELRAQGALEKAASLTTTFKLQGEQLDLAEWADVLPDESPAPETGRGSIVIAGRAEGRALAELTANVAFTDVSAVLPTWSMPLPTADPLLPPDDSDEEPAAVAAPAASTPRSASTAETRPAPPQVLSYSRLALNAHAQRQQQGWQVAVTDFELSQAASPWRSKSITASWAQSGSGELTLTAAADHLQLQNLWPLLAYLPERDDFATLRALAASGAIDNLQVSLSRAPNARPRYSLAAALNDIQVHAVRKIPQITGFNAQLSATQDEGRLRVNAPSLRVQVPWMFRNPLDATLTSTLEWRREGAGWRIASEDLQLRNADGNVSGRFALTLPGDGNSSVLDLDAEARDLNATATPKYLPANKLSANALAWLDRAFVAGHLPVANVRFHGPTRSFPFRGGEGEFVATAHVEQMTFGYQQGWTPATQLATDVEFRNEGMSARHTTARLGELQITEAGATFKDFKQGDIKIRAAVSGDLQHALSFLQHSPVGPKLGEVFEQLQGQGRTQATVNLMLPLKQLDDHQLEVTARLQDANVILAQVDAPVSKVNGTLTVRNTLVDAADLRASWLGAPLDVIVRRDPAARRHELSSTLMAKGRASAAQLSKLLQVPDSIGLSGAMNWRLVTNFVSGPQTTRAVQNIELDSDLRGLGVALPEPVGKPSDEPRALHIQVQPLVDQMLARGSYGNVRALLQLKPSNSGWTFDRGGVRADGNPAALPAHRGFRIEGDIDRFVLDDWLALKSTKGGGGGRPLSDFLRAANVNVHAFEFLGYRWSDVRGILQAAPTGWQVDVTGPTASGSVFVPTNFAGAEPLTANLEHFELLQAERETTDAAEGAPTDPRSLPNMRVHIGDLHWEDHAIGEFELRAQKDPRGLHFESITVRTAAVEGKASGDWLLTADGPRSSLNADIVSSDVTATLRALNYTPFIEAKRVEMRADLTWPGGFEGNFVGRASGSLTADAEAGQLLSLQPGAGRVLGLFSMAALRRRLSLDFSDLTEKGLSFDTVHGDFELREGNAYTSNLLLRGPAAEIGIAGRTGLGTRDYDQTAVVTGNLGASIPVAGALAGGPAVGAALLLFSQVFKESLKGIARGYYRITGTWDNPSVERVDAAEAKQEAVSER